MLKPVVTSLFVIAATIGASEAQAAIKVIYPPQSYQAQFDFCPSYWHTLDRCGCGHGHHHGHLMGQIRHGHHFMPAGNDHVIGKVKRVAAKKARPADPEAVIVPANFDGMEPELPPED